MNKYQEHGYEDRIDYLESIADDYGISYEEVKLIADLLGDEEDFDGLINTLEDAQDYFDGDFEDLDDDWYY